MYARRSSAFCRGLLDDAVAHALHYGARHAGVAAGKGKGDDKGEGEYASDGD